MEGTATLSKMKVADLKKELKARGLSMVGNKNDLIERLQDAMECGGDQVEMESGDGVDEDFDEEEILGEEDIDSELTPQEEEAALGGSAIKVSPLLEQPEKKKISLKRSQPPPIPISPESPTTHQETTSEPEEEGGEQGEGDGNADVDADADADADVDATTASTESPPKKIIKLDGSGDKSDPKARAERFGIPLTDEARKEARKARFGLTSNGASEGAKAGSQSEEEKKADRATRFGITKTGITSSKISMEGEKVEIDRLLKRAARFGEITSPALLKSMEEDKKKARMKRFAEAAGSEDTKKTSKDTKKTEETQEADDPLTEKKAKFGVITASDEEEKKRKRAERFAI